MPTLLRRVFAHWPLKLASLALAVLLWALVSAEQVTMHWIPVRVEAEVRDPRYVVTDGPGPREVRVLFAGPGRLLWQVALERPTLVVPVREPARSGYPLEAGMIRLPEGLRNVAVREIRPSIVRLEVQPLESRLVPVQARFSRASLGRYVLRGAPVLSPATVRVTGPADDLARIESLETEPVEIVSADSATFEVRVPLDTTGMAGFAVSPGVVRVRGDIDRRAERRLPAVPVRRSDEAASGTAELILSGPARSLEGVDPGDVWVEVTEQGARVRGVPASVQAAVVRRRDAPAEPAPPR